MVPWWWLESPLLLQVHGQESLLDPGEPLISATADTPSPLLVKLPSLLCVCEAKPGKCARLRSGAPADNLKRPSIADASSLYTKPSLGACLDVCEAAIKFRKRLEAVLQLGLTVECLHQTTGNLRNGPNAAEHEVAFWSMHLKVTCSYWHVNYRSAPLGNKVSEETDRVASRVAWCCPPFSPQVGQLAASDKCARF